MVILTIDTVLRFRNGSSKMVWLYVTLIWKKKVLQQHSHITWTYHLNVSTQHVTCTALICPCRSDVLHTKTCSVLFCPVLFYFVILYLVLVCPLRFILAYFLLICSLLFCSLLFHSLLICSLLFLFFLFWFVLFCFIFFCFILFCFVLFCLMQRLFIHTWYYFTLVYDFVQQAPSLRTIVKRNFLRT